VDKAVNDSEVEASPIISVLLPVYNSEKYIAEAIDSILVQTISNFELIIINDGSTDGTLAILKKYDAIDSRIRLISRENKGIVESMNEGIDLAQGEWLARMDADDIALPHRFECQLKWLKQTGADICGSWVQFFGTTDRRILKHPQSDIAIKVALLFGSALAQPVVMMKTTLIKQFYYNSIWENGEDYDLWVRTASAGLKMTNVQEVLLLYRQHSTQISSRGREQQQANTQQIRRRYWMFLAEAMAIKPEWIDEVMKIREPSAASPNMDYVDCAFNQLLQHSQGEARTVVLDYVTRLYFRVAANCPDVVKRWSRLNKDFGNGFGFNIKCRLWLLKVLRIDSDSPLFNSLKKLYFYCVARHESF
jgi:glycosyltransferase involved in cell wall biosynthesis